VGHTNCPRGRLEISRRSVGGRGMGRMITRIAYAAALFLLVLPLPVSHAKIRSGGLADYRVTFQWVHVPSGNRFIAVRRFVRAGTTNFLLVNPQTFESSVARASTLALDGPATFDDVRETPFGHALLRYTAPPYHLRNYGAVHAMHSVDGMYLTVDLCPTAKPLDRTLFEQMLEEGAPPSTPLPVAIAITGQWMDRHPQDLTWLEEQVQDHHLAITWVNHSYDHPYTPNIPADYNFLLSPGVDFQAQVLRTEVALLERGLVPSPFFRFPGLVSNGEMVEQLRTLSLIPIGTDAWLAKGQRAREGSFILVHANGNEPLGVNRFLRLRHRRPDVSLLPLPTAFSTP
jgi:hypothetical protein